MRARDQAEGAGSALLALRVLQSGLQGLALRANRMHSQAS